VCRVVCRAVRSSQSEALRAAARTLAQWQTHVRAMNQLVAGEITLGQAAKSWNATRIGAARRVEAFRSADAEVASAGRCSASAEPTRSTADDDPVATCVRSVGLRVDALEAARVSIQTWHHHLRDMEPLRTGQMSPARATRLWLENWREGVKELDGYDDLLRRTTQVGGCPAT
jgi:hypothetical protein